MTVNEGAEELTLHRVDPQGGWSEIGRLLPHRTGGSSVGFLASPGWPLDGDMAAGHFDGLPYFLGDMRPQGHLGRQFARLYASALRISPDPSAWSDDAVLHALSSVAWDSSGDLIVGKNALQGWRMPREQDHSGLTDVSMPAAYAALAAGTLLPVGSCPLVGGEMPKFTALRRIGGVPTHVIVKFSGSDESPGTQRWSDLLVCEQIASSVIAARLGVPAARSRIVRAGGRTFLEVERFDRHGAHGRSSLCSWAALNAGLVGLAGRPWTEGAARLQAAGFLDAAGADTIARLWHFGQLIANTDMHDGNLSFQPGLRVAPAYDMLPMLYAPQRGVELPQRSYTPRLPLPAEREAWQQAAVAALAFWEQAAADARIGSTFREQCARNAETLQALAGHAAAATPSPTPSSLTHSARRRTSR